ncbi:hypothetical protein QMK19_19415 [Streptomyces sp. H10-C2]|uniref:hypothetical protein n=1 Tax=unclassified Streptomyces TaxID=2593676 RepID=UPI0024BAC108|nr:MULTISPECIES: hypothetical protein [unclassified Streptomyces]MDJ0343402.1 hypothetical protein [Streptomyces sp. PH10-H1]MDJ0371787.1 hypothetical protein [Streptomyces sp. H10-C2]
MITTVCACGDNIGVPKHADAGAAADGDFGAERDDQFGYHGDDAGRPTDCPLNAPAESSLHGGKAR